MRIKIKKIINILTNRNETLATMESCTGGGVANEITSVEGASDILKFSAVTYSNEYKIKMGVDKNIIDKYTVYSKETAEEMALNISKFANSNYGIGITGKLNRVDKYNPGGADNIVYFSIYDKNNNKFYDYSLEVDGSSRKINKKKVIEKIIDELYNIIIGD